MKKGQKLYSILRFKCPHCHEGAFFENDNPFAFSKLGEVRKICPVCGRSYHREVGFYYGAMYVSYALAVATFVAVYVAVIVLFPSASAGVLVAAVLGSLVVLGPVLYALSKIIWANLFYSYQGPAAGSPESKASDR
ncbi:MAG TPA: DUF983 domain-containing protein [Flavobacteriales bacterium]|nr:hypothetical protein [Flavobacteriales bacterium]MCC6400136.1 DUF983 domain-containing protein [Flavobacteriales bacterium]HQW85860.1 DUF983 domain-containing protein [Flavobacteriales bacterium]